LIKSEMGAVPGVIALFGTFMIMVIILAVLALTATELALLRKLAENRGHIVTYDALCAAVWGADYYGYENSLGVHIRHLREKLEAEPGAPQFLRTVRGIGYKLTKGEEA
jgi:DNA-binding response OmpR family regulator